MTQSNNDTDTASWEDPKYVRLIASAVVFSGTLVFGHELIENMVHVWAYFLTLFLAIFVAYAWDEIIKDVQNRP